MGSYTVLLEYADPERSMRGVGDLSVPVKDFGRADESGVFLDFFHGI